MTLNDIEQASYRRLGYADVPATEVITRMRQWINIWHQRLLARPGVQILRDITVTMPSVALQPQYVLPVSVRRVQKVSEATTPATLHMEDFSWVREMDPQGLSIGVPEVWCPISWAMSAGPLSQLTIRLWPTPAGVITYAIDCQTTAVDMVASTDQPLLPPEYHWLLVQAASYEEWLRKADTRAGTARQDLESGMKEMRHWLLNPPDYKPRMGQSDYLPSRLGGQFPSW